MQEKKEAGRLIFLRSELDEFFKIGLEGCTIEEAKANIEARQR
jgi:hypothetical protein